MSGGPRVMSVFELALEMPLPVFSPLEAQDYLSTRTLSFVSVKSQLDVGHVRSSVEIDWTPHVLFCFCWKLTGHFRCPVVPGTRDWLDMIR